MHTCACACKITREGHRFEMTTRVHQLHYLSQVCIFSLTKISKQFQENNKSQKVEILSVPSTLKSTRKIRMVVSQSCALEYLHHSSPIMDTARRHQVKKIPKYSSTKENQERDILQVSSHQHLIYILGKNINIYKPQN